MLTMYAFFPFRGLTISGKFKIIETRNFIAIIVLIEKYSHFNVIQSTVN